MKHRTPPSFLLAAIVGVIAKSLGWSATGLWMGAAGDQDWTASQNWQSNIIPGTTSATNNSDTAEFHSNNGDTTISTPANLNLQKFQFGAGAGRFTIGAATPNTGPAIRLSAASEIKLESGYQGAGVFFHAPLELYGNGTFSTDALSPTASLIIAGNVSKATGGAATLTLTGGGVGVFSGNIVNQPNLAISKTGAGLWDLQGNNTQASNTSISAGTLLVNSTVGSATGTGGVAVSGSGTLGGKGVISGGNSTTLSTTSSAKLMIGNTHGLANGETSPAGYIAEASGLTLGSLNNVTINLTGALQFDLFDNQDGLTTTEADRLYLITQASTLNLAGSIQIANATGSRKNLTSGQWQLIDWSGVNRSTTTVTGSPSFSTPTNMLEVGYRWNTSQITSTGILSIEEDPLTYRWTGAFGTTEWGKLENWEFYYSGAPITALPAATNSVIFGATSQPATGLVTIAHNTDTRAKDILFTGERNYQINVSGGVFFFDGNLLHSKGGSQNLNGQLRITQSAPTILVDSGVLDIGAVMSNSATTLTFDGAGDTNIHSISRRFDIVFDTIKRGTGTLTIKNFNNNNPTLPTEFLGGGAQVKGRFTIEEGTVRILDERSLGANPNDFTANQLTLNGGRLLAYTNDVVIDDSNRGVTIGSSGGTIGAEANRKLTISTPITGSGQLNIQGPGDVYLTQSNTHQGGTRVVEGRLWVTNSQGSATGSGDITILNGTQIGGTGTVSPSNGKTFQLQSGGQLLIGNTHGSGAVASQLIVGDSSAIANFDVDLLGTIKFDITGSGSLALFGDSTYLTPSSNHADILKIVTNGEIEIGPIQIDINPLNTSGWQLGQLWKVIDWSIGSPTLAVTASPTLTNSTFGAYQLATVVASDGLYVQIVPEPKRWLLITLGTAALLRRRRRPAAAQILTLQSLKK